MKKLSLYVFVSALSLLTGFARASESAGVRGEIQPLLDELLSAANAHDTDRFLALYLHTSDLVTVYNGVTTLGWDEARAIQFKVWNGGKSEVVYSQDGAEQFTVLGSNDVVVTEPLAAERKLADGRISHTKFVATMVWEKRPEGWRIVQAHESSIPK
jgi:ketosteroid isomerase-like protein